MTRFDGQAGGRTFVSEKVLRVCLSELLAAGRSEGGWPGFESAQSAWVPRVSRFETRGFSRGSDGISDLKN